MEGLTEKLKSYGKNLLYGTAVSAALLLNPFKVNAEEESPFYKEAIVSAYSKKIEEAKTEKKEIEARIFYDFSNPHIISPENVVSSSLFLSRGINLGLEKLILPSEGNRKDDMTNIVTGAIYYFVSSLLNFNVSFADHEYGHAYFLSRYTVDHGFKNIKGKKIDFNPASAVLVSFLNYAEPGSWEVVPREEVKQDDFKYKINPNKINAALMASGFNMQMLTLEEMADDILDGKGRITDMPVYHVHMTYAPTYLVSRRNIEGGDLNQYIDFLDKNGVNTNEATVRLLPLASILSGSHLSLLKQIPDYKNKGQVKVEPIKFDVEGFDVFLPEFNAYFTTKGPSLKIKERVKNGSLIFEASYEKPMPKNNHELGLGVRYSNPEDPFTAEASFAYNTKSAFHANARVGVKPVLMVEKMIRKKTKTPVLSDLELGFNAYFFRGDSLIRERLGRKPVEETEEDNGVQAYLLLKYEF